MIVTRRIEIIVETEREIVVTRPIDGMIFCPRCNKDASMIVPEDGAAERAVSVGLVYRPGEDGNLHYTEAVEEGLVVCEMSLG
jgi:hypothetical protein